MTVSMAPTKPARSSLASASLRYSEIRAGSRYSSKSSLLDIRVLSSGHFRKLVWYMGDRIGLESGYAGCTVSRFPVRIQMKKLFIALTAVAAFAAPAIAADLPARTYKAPPPPAPVYNWTGFY